MKWLKNKKYLSLLVVTILATAAISLSFTNKKDNDISKVKWYSFEDAVALNQVEPKKMIIDVYTDWCGPCKIMDRQVFGDAKVAAYINEHYYPVKLNAEYKEPIQFDGQEFKFVDAGRRGYHELAYSILQGRMSYPSVVFMDEEMNVINRVSGVQPKDLFKKYIKYVNENKYKNVDWFEYSKQKVR